MVAVKGIQILSTKIFVHVAMILVFNKEAGWDLGGVLDLKIIN